MAKEICFRNLGNTSYTLHVRNRKEKREFEKKAISGIMLALLIMGVYGLVVREVPLASKVAMAKTPQSTYKRLGWDSIVMLIGDLDESGPNPLVKSQLLKRINLANESGVDTVIIVFKTSSVEDTPSELDEITEYAASRGIAVIPRIVVNSKYFTEFIVTHDDILPDYTNLTQLNSAVNLLKKVVSHLENFSNIVAYQVEWGHYGESWINSPFWNSASSNSSFVNYLRSISPEFQNVTTYNFANWVTQDIMYYSEYLPQDDPRRRAFNVALFYWYQEWRNNMTQNITYTFRSIAKQVTEKPIIGFSYTGTGTVSYVYSANKYLDAAFSDFVPSFNWKPNKNFIRDAYFKGLHLGELDFDTPYFSISQAEDAVAGMYRRGIVPIIFYPLWSRELQDTDIPILVNYMKTYNTLGKSPSNNEILMVIGRNDIGFSSFQNEAAIPVAREPWISLDPPGVMAILETYNLTYDIIDPEVYEPEIGDTYKGVIVFVPRDTVDQPFIKKLENTTSSLLVMHPSFIIGTPSIDDPVNTTSAIFGMWNRFILKGRKIKVGVYGQPGPDIIFVNELSDMGRIDDYATNHLFSYYDGSFESLYALTEWGYPVVAQIENIAILGLNTVVENQTQRDTIESAFIKMLELLIPVNDVAITNISLSKQSLVRGETIYINVTVENQGDFTETFNVTTFANTTYIGKQNATNLNPNASTILSFPWETSGFAKGNYIISAYAWPVAGEKDTADNNHTYSFVIVTEHDVGIANILLSKTVVSPGEIVYVNVTVENQGDYTETFNVTVYYNLEPVENQILSLVSEASRTLSFSWNTTGIPKGDYKITAKTSKLPAEIDVTDNTKTAESTVTVLSLGHDVAIKLVYPSKEVVGQGYSLSVGFTVMNYGNFSETFNVTAYINTTIVQTQTITLSSGNSTVVTFTWNTTGFAKGNYTISTYAGPVLGEIDTTDNNFTDGWVIVAMVGDITGPDGWPDDKVDIRDIALVATKFGVIYPDPKYNPNCDITGPTLGIADGKIDIRDIALVAIHFGEIGS